MCLKSKCSVASNKSPPISQYVGKSADTNHSMWAGPRNCIQVKSLSGCSLRVGSQSQGPRASCSRAASLLLLVLPPRVVHGNVQSSLETFLLRATHPWRSHRNIPHKKDNRLPPVVSITNKLVCSACSLAVASCSGRVHGIKEGGLGGWSGANPIRCCIMANSRLTYQPMTERPGRD